MRGLRRAGHAGRRARPAGYRDPTRGHSRDTRSPASRRSPRRGCEDQVCRAPDRTAVVDYGVELTYAELNARANRLARALVERGAGPERVVAVVLPRTADLVTALLAVAKTGAAFLPVDPAYPAYRIDFLLADAAPAAVLTAMPSDLAGRGAADLADADRISPLRPDHPAYLIYTSGSTGRPKGVVVTHTGLPDMARVHAALGVGGGRRRAPGAAGRGGAARGGG
ncbi:AMP-binding protein, partial [Saccharothrix sp. MB29]|nr:AMP-binding protein [Saccharothrix sp. MB29]